jgi:hypothetical protein
MAKLRFVGSFAALCACPALAVDKPPQCLTPVEAEAMMDFALPELLNSVTDKCAAELPKTSFLSTRGKQLAASYRIAAEPRWPAAKAAIAKLGGDDDAAKIFAAMPDDSIKALMAAAMGVGLTDKLEVAQCSGINDIAASLAPLPPQDLSRLIVSILLVAGKDDSGEFRICK